MVDSVTRLIFAVEGRTEDNFVRSSLRDHLWGFGLASSSTIVGKAKAAARGNSGRGMRGGGCYADWEMTSPCAIALLQITVKQTDAIVSNRYWQTKSTTGDSSHTSNSMSSRLW